MTPTIHDILGYQGGLGEERGLRFPNLPPEHYLNQQGITLPQDVATGPKGADPSGQRSMAEYLMSLVGESGAYADIAAPFSSNLTTDQGIFTEEGRRLDTSKSLGLSADIWGEEDFMGMSRDELGGYISSQYEKPYTEGGGLENIGEDNLNSMISYLQSMQEGLGRVGSITDKFGLEGQLASEETGQERDIKTALQAYMPREITSRYGSLQSGGGGGAGEMSEAKYLSTLSEGERRRGRNVRSIYGELEDEMFGGLGKWMGGVTS